MKQLELFPEYVDVKKELEVFRNELDRYRKALFAREAELRKLYNEVAHRQSILEMNICKGKIVI